MSKNKPLKRRGEVEKTYRVRVPDDYPWIVLNLLIEDSHHVLDSSEVECVLRIIRKRDISQLLDLSVRWGLQRITPCGLASIRAIRTRLCVGQLIKKFPFPGDHLLRKEAGLKAVHDSEATCSYFNTKGYRRLYDDEGKLHPLIESARSFIAANLGACPDLKDPGLTDLCRHGPGTTTSASLRTSSRYFKYREWPYHVTTRALAHARRLILSDPRWLGALEASYRDRLGIKPWQILDWDVFWSSVFTIRDHNRITTVPKDGQKDRPIAIEPTLNVVLQLGVEGYIRRRLKRWGIDLDDQSKNQRLSYEGSLSGPGDKPATIDLANASDSISLRICKILLPPDWYEYLCDLRSPKGELPDKQVLRFSKISSMGNGATFAVESLIFASIAYACSLYVYGRFRRDLISVFGDDIVVPEPMAQMTCNVLEACGFSINRTKSFLQGQVKESCGTDWVNGQSVRPVYLKRTPEYVDDLITHRNIIYRWFVRTHGHIPSNLEGAFLGWIPNRFHLFGPYSDEEFSGYLHSPIPFGYENGRYVFKSITSRPRSKGGHDFLFRKIMHPLRQMPECQWRNPSTNSGSTFDVVDASRVSRSVVRRTVPDWCSTYRPLMTLDPSDIEGSTG